MTASLWIVARHAHSGIQTDCAIVTADTAGEAAEAGTLMLVEDAAIEGGDSLEETVAVFQVNGDPEWFGFSLRAERAELQCCGGNAHTDDGHSGYCPEHTE